MTSDDARKRLADIRRQLGPIAHVSHGLRPGRENETALARALVSLVDVVDAIVTIDHTQKRRA